jgi:membrane associated rhomboid family serine protease
MAYYKKAYKRRLSFGQGNNALITLIAINLVVFIIFVFIEAIFRLRYENREEAITMFNKNVLSWFTLPADINKIGARPWTIITHIFVHIDFWRVFANMLWLWMFGYIMQDLTGNKKIFPVFIYGALAGALAFVLAYNFLPAFKPQLLVQSALGASAGIMAIAVAATVVAPDYRIFPMLNGGIRLWILTMIYIIIVLVTIPANNPGGHISHLAAALMGGLFIYFFRKGYDMGKWMNDLFDWFNDLFNPDKPKKGKHIKQELFYKATATPYKKTPNVTEQRIDEILDKISQKGYNSLNEEEKELLKRASEKDR